MPEHGSPRCIAVFPVQLSAYGVGKCFVGDHLTPLGFSIPLDYPTPSPNFVGDRCIFRNEWGGRDGPVQVHGPKNGGLEQADFHILPVEAVLPKLAAGAYDCTEGCVGLGTREHLELFMALRLHEGIAWLDSVGTPYRSTPERLASVPLDPPPEWQSDPRRHQLPPEGSHVFPPLRRPAPPTPTPVAAPSEKRSFWRRLFPSRSPDRGSDTTNRDDPRGSFSA